MTLDEIIEVMAVAIEKANAFYPYETNERDLARAAFKALQDYMPDGGDIMHMEKKMLVNLHGNRAELWTEMKNLGR